MPGDIDESTSSRLDGQPATANTTVGFAELQPALYIELRRMAAAKLGASARRHTLPPTALVHEAFLRMGDQSPEVRKDPVRFKHAAALMLWRVLLDHEKSRRALRRGGGVGRVEIDEAVAPAEDGLSLDVLALRDALAKLFEQHERVARVVLLLYFAGLTIREAAGELKLSERQVDNDWKYAKGWLRRELRDAAELA